MSILLLSLLLLLLVGIGALMGRRVVAMERFQDAPVPAPTAAPPSEPVKQLTGTINLDVLARDVAVQDAVLEGGKKHNNVVPNPYPPSISPAGPIIILPNLGPGGQYNPIPTPAPNPTPTPGPAPNPDPYPPRPAPNPNPYQPNPPPGPPSSCGWCPSCPDMSQYIRMDEIPCWNCTLP